MLEVCLVKHDMIIGEQSEEGVVGELYCSSLMVFLVQEAMMHSKHLWQRCHPPKIHTGSFFGTHFVNGKWICSICAIPLLMSATCVWSLSRFSPSVIVSRPRLGYCMGVRTTGESWIAGPELRNPARLLSFILRFLC